MEFSNIKVRLGVFGLGFLDFVLGMSFGDDYLFIIYLRMHVFVQCTHHISDCNYTDMLLFPVPSLTSSQRYMHASMKLENNRGQQIVKRYDFLLPVFDITDTYVRLYNV